MAELESQDVFPLSLRKQLLNSETALSQTQCRSLRSREAPRGQTEDSEERSKRSTTRACKRLRMNVAWQTQCPDFTESSSVCSDHRFCKGRAVPAEEDACTFPVEEPMDGVCIELSTLWWRLQLKEEHFSGNHQKTECTTGLPCAFAGVIDPPCEEETPPASSTEEREDGLWYLASR